MAKKWLKDALARSQAQQGSGSGDNNGFPNNGL
jgi:hypothetical protein